MSLPFLRPEKRTKNPARHYLRYAYKVEHEKGGSYFYRQSKKETPLFPRHFVPRSRYVTGYDWLEIA